MLLFKKQVKERVKPLETSWQSQVVLVVGTVVGWCSGTVVGTVVQC